MRWSRLGPVALLAFVVMSMTSVAVARPALAVAPLEGDTDGAISDVVAEAAAEHGKTTKPERVAREIEKLDISALTSKSIKKLRTKLVVDVVIHGKVRRSGPKKHLELVVSGAGKAKGSLEVDYRSTKDLRKALESRLGKQIDAATGGADGGDDEAEEDSHRDSPLRGHKGDDEDRKSKSDDDDRKSRSSKSDDDDKHSKRDDDDRKSRSDDDDRKSKSSRSDDDDRKSKSDDDDHKSKSSKSDDDDKHSKRGDDDDKHSKRDDDDRKSKSSKRDDDDKHSKRDDDDKHAKRDDDEKHSKRGDDDEKHSKRGDDDDKHAKRDDDDKHSKRDDDKRGHKRTSSRDDDESISDGSDDDAEEDGGSRHHKKRHHRRDERNALTQAAALVEIGGAFARRTLTYDATGTTQPPPVGTVAPALGLQGEIYPGSFSTLKGPAAGIGLAGAFDRSVGLGIAVPGTTIVAPIKSGSYWFGARYRFTFGGSSIAVGASYWARYYIADRSKLMMPEQLDMPDVSYKAVAPDVTGRFAVTPKLAVFGALQVPLMLTSGPIQKTTSYGPSKILAFDVRTGVQISLAAHYAIQVALDFDQIGFTFNAKMGSQAALRGVSAATDRSLGLAATLGINY